jgi:HAD superfamily hydrolase (TIGR01509 family)
LNTAWPRPHRGPAAVCFDLDGVLIDSEGAWDAARRSIVREAGGAWRPGATEAMMGMSSREWSAHLHDELGVALEPAQISDRVVERLLAQYERELPLLPGAVTTVRALAEHWPLGLASSSNRPVIDAFLALSGLADLFAATVSGDEVARGKPAPDIYLAATAKLAVDPHQTAAVEDSSNGLRAASAAGMIVIAIPDRDLPPAQDALELAKLTLESISELTPQVVQTFTTA